MNDDIAHIQSLSTTPRYNIKAVVRQTQINISTLRAWEQRYGMPNPTRSDHGHRLYSARDVATIKWLKQCTERGVNISQAVALLREQQTSPQVAEPVDDVVPIHTGMNLGRLREHLLSALEQVNLHRAHLVTNTACAMFPLDVVVLELLYPVQKIIGERWASGQICVAEERMVTNFIRQRIQSLMQIHEPFAHGPRIITGCAPQEQHEIGLLMFTLMMELRGWQGIYLGQSLGVDGLADFLKRLSPALVYFNITMVEHMSGLLDLCRVVEELQDDRLVLAYGGKAFEMHPELRERLPGMYLGNDLSEAVARADALGDQIDMDRSRVRYRPIQSLM